VWSAQLAAESRDSETLGDQYVMMGTLDGLPTRRDMNPEWLVLSEAPEDSHSAKSRLSANRDLHCRSNGYIGSEGILEISCQLET
jgi:hypothetical protein